MFSAVVRLEGAQAPTRHLIVTPAESCNESQSSERVVAKHMLLTITN